MPDIEKLLQELTLEEKASLSSGLFFWTTKPIDRLGIPAVTMTDGPHGLRKEFGADAGKGGVNIMKGSEPATCFPPAVLLASTWDPELLGQIGTAIAEEAKSLNVSTVLGPGVNIKRSPLCGRNFEYFSEDPYLAGELATSYINGVQAQGVGTSLKHFCANNAEYCRMSIESRIDERALREIYLPAFENAVKRAQPQQVMCAYNKLNGFYLSENRRMLTEILREEWGFKGMVVSDWGAVNDRVLGVLAGLDLQMPGAKGAYDKILVKAVRDNQLAEADLDAIIRRVLKYVFECDANRSHTSDCDFAAHHELCRKAGARGAVLLKNEGNLLPVAKTESIAVIGALVRESRYQGSGSSRICCKNLVNIGQALDAEGITYEYAEGYKLKGDGYSKKLLEKALAVAKGKDKVVVVAGLTDAYESEGFDRTHMSLPAGHDILIKELVKVNPNVIVVLEGGSPVEMPWLKDVKALLNTYLLGEAVGETTVDLLFGKVNPSGKLAETFPVCESDVFVDKYFPMGPKTIEYRESIFVGYRYYETAHKPVAFPFGYGLSYTKFTYSNLVCPTEYREGDTVKVSFDITNSGACDGEEIAQLYVRQKDSQVFKPALELKGFKKVALKKGETKTVELTLDSRAFAFYNTAVSAWTVLSGDYELLVGENCESILLSAPLKVTSATPDVCLPDESGLEVYRNIGGATEITKEQFERLYGDILPDNVPYKKGEFHFNSTLGELTATHLGRLIMRCAKIGGRIVAGDSVNATMIINTIAMIPLRALCGFTGGFFSIYSVYGLVDIFNGTKGGFRKFMRGFRKKYK